MTLFSDHYYFCGWLSKNPNFLILNYEGDALKL